MGRKRNPFFQFKQFRVAQDQCGMKICTDACILGAWTPISKNQKVLDIGAGTGLLSLMLAQRSSAKIDAIELDDDAYQQAKGNFEQSPWANRLQLFHMPVQEFSTKAPNTYDLIITNPPFYPDHLQPEDIRRSKAHHNDTLSFTELIESISALLSEEGQCAILLPERQMNELTAVAMHKSIYPYKKLIIRDREGKQVLRVVQLFSRKEQGMVQSEELLIKNPDGSYSEPYAELMREFLIIF